MIGLAHTVVALGALAAEPTYTPTPDDPTLEPAPQIGPTAAVPPPAEPWRNRARTRRLFFDVMLELGGGRAWGTRDREAFGFGRLGLGVLAVVDRFELHADAVYDISTVDLVAFGLETQLWYPRYLLHVEAAALATPDGRFGVIGGLGASLFGIEYQFRDTLELGLTSVVLFKLMMPLTVWYRMASKGRF